jgi:two-component system alkaline phosphatase synthesis response regulator PhoP
MSNSKDTLLIIEDEEAIGEGLQFNFQAEGYEVKLIADGLEGLTYLKENHERISVVILDLMLPKVDGYGILTQTRELAERIPILILSAKSMHDDKIKAFELGADDFVTKPFHLSEIILRVKRLVKTRKWGKKDTENITKNFGSCLYDSDKLLLLKENQPPIRISPTEGLLIEILLEHEGKILSRTELLQKVWQYSAVVETRTVDVFMSKLRKHIEKNPSKPEYIVSVRGAGYIYTANQNKS